jgi:hypothetical protein
MASEPETENVDGLVCWVCQFVDCDEHPEEPLLSTGCACCRPLALGSLAGALANSGDNAAARPLYEELVTVERRTWGKDDPATLENIGRLGTLLEHIILKTRLCSTIKRMHLQPRSP